MKKLIATILLAASLSGCVVSAGIPVGRHAYLYAPVVVGTPPIGYYDPYRGYWTGYEWDIYYYRYGHRGYGHEHDHYRHY